MELTHTIHLTLDFFYTRDGEYKAVVEASDIGLAPGEWPRLLKYNDDEYSRSYADPHGAFVRYQSAANATIEVIND